MNMMKMLTAGVAALSIASTAHAGDNSCLGEIIVSGNQARIVEDTGSTWTCGTFSVNSDVGRRILKVCPNGSTCFIDQPLPPGGDVSKKRSLEIKKPTAVERM
jgi:hypothetical protein